MSRTNVITLDIPSQKAVNETQAQMNVAQSELDIYLSREKKEKQVLESMKEELATATNNFLERQKSLKELENNMPAWSKAVAEKQAELNQVISFLS